MNRATEDRQAVPVPARSVPTPQRACLVGKHVAVLTGGLLMSIALASCAVDSPTKSEMASAAPSAVDGAGANSQPTATQPGPERPSLSGDDAATAAVKQKMTDALVRLAATAPKPATAQVTDALTAAGIAPAMLEVSASRTPTGLEADAVDAAVLEGSDCVVGQIRDGSVTVTVLPVLASGKCFVGSGA